MFKNILYGLIPAQIIAFCHVYSSNLNLYRFLLEADRLGYLIVPGQDVLPELQSVGTAFWGGLFFTLSLGAGISILTYSLCWAWVYLFKRNRYILFAFTGLWLLTILFINQEGFALFPSLYLFIIPGFVFLGFLWSISGHGDAGKPRSALLHLIPVLVLAVLWIMEYDREMFLDIRDSLLLSNKIGQEINRFYYHYTLYPAETFKTLEQKQLKGGYVIPTDDRDLMSRLEDKLLDYDYLILNSSRGGHLTVRTKDGVILFNHKGKTVYRVSVRDFFRNPGAVLETCSRKTDTNGPFRYLIFLTLLVGFPLLLYLIIYTIFGAVMRRLNVTSWWRGMASLLCLVLGLAVLFLFHDDKGYHLTADNIEQALAADNRRQRRAALKLITERKLEIGKYSSYKKLLASPYISEKYWLAKALGQSRGPSTMKDLITLADDPHLNVVCMAIDSLGRRREKDAIPLLLKKINSAGYWYVEWYAYRALRILGWKQKRL